MMQTLPDDIFTNNLSQKPLLERHQFLGGTDITALLGLSTYRSPVDVWLEKTQQSKPQADSLILRFGRFAEDFVVQEYERETGFITARPNGITQHPQHHYLAGNIDRLVVSGDASVHRILECKTSHPRNSHQWGEPGTDQVPLHYLVQCLWYLMLTQCEECDLAVLIGNNDFRIYTITRNVAVEDLLLDRAIHFWEHHVLQGTPPIASSESDYRSLFPNSHPGESVEATPVLMKHLQRLHEIHRHMHQEEVEISAIKQIIMDTLKEADTLTFENRIIATWKTPKPSLKTDWKRLEKDHPDWVASYQFVQENSRRLLIKDFNKV